MADERSNPNRYYDTGLKRWVRHSEFKSAESMGLQPLNIPIMVISEDGAPEGTLHEDDTISVSAFDR